MAKIASSVMIIKISIYNYIDKRIQDGMDAEETVSSSTPGGSTDPGDASQPDNTVAKIRAGL